MPVVSATTQPSLHRRLIPPIGTALLLPDLPDVQATRIVETAAPHHRSSAFSLAEIAVDKPVPDFYLSNHKCDLSAHL
ncbi:hypothetical protein [Paraburkholderia heleia]|uniref:hypothetical protein n=1 Tax=Paraburkholderia heleia TaxID=634127 RepID=UPI0012ED3FC9|nr:hypothetical protein [Paraburkholderia heleia]